MEISTFGREGENNAEAKRQSQALKMKRAPPQRGSDLLSGRRHYFWFCGEALPPCCPGLS